MQADYLVIWTNNENQNHSAAHLQQAADHLDEWTEHNHTNLSLSKTIVAQ